MNRNVCVLLFGTVLSMGCSNVRLGKVEARPLPKVFSVRVANYCPDAGYTMKEVFAVNQSALMPEDEWVVDFDRDGLSDAFELAQANRAQYDILANIDDTNGDGYRDNLMVRTGTDLNRQSGLRACIGPYNDSDKDGLFDCEEEFLKLNPTNPDTDGDGIPDGVEVRASLNPNDPHDAVLDTDKDGISNLVEIIANTPIANTNTARNEQLKLGYEMRAPENEQGGCVDIVVRNLPLLNVNNGNLVEVAVLESLSNGRSQMKYVRVVVPKSEVSSTRIRVGGGILNQTVVPGVPEYLLEVDD